MYNDKFQILSVLTSCLVITTGSQEEDFSQFSDLRLTTGGTEDLPVPASQTGPEARNYVAYIPVPINDDEEEEEGDDEYYDDYEEYYEDEYEYEEEEEKRPSRKKNRRRHKDERKSKPSKGRYHPSKSSAEDKERVPFLVPLMMVPENQVGVQKEFTFSKNPNERIQNVGEDDDGDDGGVFTSILNLNNNKRFPPGGPARRPQARPRPGGIPSRSTHNVPGPPYRGPPPRNPRLPLDQTVIHPSIHRPRWRRPPRNFRPRQYSPSSSSTSTTAVPSTTETTTPETVTKAKANIIVVQQQPAYSPYRPPHYSYNPYQPPPAYQPYPYQPYPSPPPPPTTTTTTTTTTRSTTTTQRTTTKKSKKKRKKRKKKPEFVHQTNLSEDQMTSLSQPQLTIVDNKLVPIMNKQQQSILSKRFGLQARRFNPPFKVRGRRRLTGGGVGGSQSSPHRGPYRDQRPHSERRFDMPNIFTQSGFQYENQEEERPIISRPPPRHPGVRVPGVRVPANAGSIEDIIQPKPVTNNYRPPVKNVVQVHYEEKPHRRPGAGDNKYQKPAHRPHHYDSYDKPPARPHYDEPPFKPDNDPPYRPPSRPPSRPPPSSNYRPKPSNVYDEPPPRPQSSYDYDHRPNIYDEPPPRPQPSNDYDYRPRPSTSYEEPPRPPASTEYDYGPPSFSEYEEPPRRPRPPNVDDGSQYGASGPSSYPEDSQAYYEPPDNEFGPIVETPDQYRPVVPPAYNQDYYLTPDPQNELVYPGPEIYDGASVHGPTSGDRKTQLGYRPAQPTLGPPTRSPHSYQASPPSPPHRDSGYQARPADVDKYDSERFHPDGPDYSSGTLINSYKGSAPFKVGVDLYPMGGVSPLGGFGKQDIYSSVIPPDGGRDGGDNKHEILLHLNLFSKKPSILGGRSRSRAGSRAQDIDLDSPSQETR